MSQSDNFFLRHFGPACLAGITTSNWLKLLIQNGFRISPRYWGKVPWLSLNAPISSGLGACEQLMYRKKIKNVEVKDPVFILGCWRSGTTHLHNLMCLDDQFAYSSLYQTMFPHSFLVSESWWRPVLDMFTPKKRFMDNMEQGLKEPHEDEMALCIMTLRSNMLSWAFPQRAKHYDKFLSFKDASTEDREIWKSALDTFVRKLTIRDPRQLILKSPNHTARIKLILEQYPNAKFIHLHRNPYDVYRSLVHMAEQVTQVWGLQYLPPKEIPKMVIETYDRLYSSYLDDVSAIPQGQFCEVAYQDVVADPIGTLQRVYEEIHLDNYDELRPKLEKYVAEKSNYQRNKHADFPADTLKTINEQWARYFEAFGYERRLSEERAIPT